ncbi:MAG: cysteine--tRNA ligase [Candidatus Paceibacterota bacterium]
MFLSKLFQKEKGQEIYFFNTLTHKKEKFIPINKKEIGMYSCGPTVYNYMHVGNLRSYVFADTVKRVLQYNGYNVKHIINVTDIGHLTSDNDEGEDKMVKALKREGKAMTLENLREVANFYFDKFKDDFEKINIINPEKFVFASDEIPAQVKLIETLLEKGFAYKTSDGIYFDTAKLSDYGRLGGANSEMESRIAQNAEKKDQRDFALWKFSSTLLTASAEIIGFEASFGKGFPGWHIECSAMAMKYLGNTFDIHTGGIDHIPVHHNNEIAQSEAATGKLLANYWLHNNFITIGEDKMAKSGENFLTLNTLIEKGINPLAYRYWLLQSRYSTRMDFSIDAIKAAQTAFERLAEFISNTEKIGKINLKYKEKFNTATNDDLDTPKAIALVWEILKDTSLSDEDKKATILDFDKVLGFELSEVKKTEIEIPAEIQKLLDERKIAKENKDWAKADEIREKIKRLGYEIIDSSSDQKLKII